MSWANDRSILVVDFYFRKLNTLKSGERDKLSAFSRFLQHSSISLAHEFTSIQSIKHFIAREISAIKYSIENGDDYPPAYKLYVNDRRIFYDKVKTILSKMNANCNYTQNFSICSPQRIVEKSWFLQEYLYAKCDTTAKRQSIENQLIMFFTMTETETRKSGVLTNDFSPNSLASLKSSICGKYVEQSIDYYLFEENNCHNCMSPSELLNSLIAFSKEYTAYDNESVINRQSHCEDYLFDYDEYEKVAYKKKDDSHFYSISEPYFEKFCVMPYDYFDETLNNMPLSPKTLACLNSGGINNLCDMLLSSPQDLSKIHNFGPCMQGELLSYLNRRFGEPKNDILKSQLRCRQSVELRRMLPYTKQMALLHLKNMANGIDDVYEFGLNTQNSIQQIFDTLGSDMCRLLTEDSTRAIYISAFIEDALDLEDRKLTLRKLFEILPQTSLCAPIKPLMELCDAIHNTLLNDIAEFRNLKTVNDIELAQNVQLRRKEFCDTKFFLEWINDGLQGIANKILDKLFAKHYARLEIFSCLADGKSYDETAVENDITRDTVCAIEGQVLRQYAKLPECKEVVCYVNALLNNIGNVSKQQFLKAMNTKDNLVIFYLASKAQSEYYVYNEQNEIFYIDNP